MEINEKQSNKKIVHSFVDSCITQLACMLAKVQSKKEKTFLNRGEARCTLIIGWGDGGAAAGQIWNRASYAVGEGYTFGFLWVIPK